MSNDFDFYSSFFQFSGYFPCFFLTTFSFKRIVEYTADEHNGFNAVVRREPVDAKIVKKVYEPEYVKHHLAPVGPIPGNSGPLKYYSTHQQAPEAAIIAQAPIQKVYAPAVLHHQKIKPQPFIAPQQYYAPPENPKFYKPIEKSQRFFKPAHEYEPQHSGIKYVSPSSHYNHY